MSAAPAFSTPSPLSEDRLARLARLVDGLDAAGLWWLSGHVAGLARGHAAAAVPAAASAPQTLPGQRLTVLYGSQTGNAKRAAEHLARQAQADGLAVRLVRADAYPTRELTAERLLYVVISTQGEGDPPDDAIGFAEFLAGRRAPRLPDLKYAVLGLGDSGYADFCGISRRIDARLAELGATRLLPAGEADVDVDTVAEPWREQAVARARELLAAVPNLDVTALRPHGASSGETATAPHDRQHPFPAEVLASQPLSGRNWKGTGFRLYRASDKDVRHIELSLQGSGLRYEPGDALGVWPRNADALVDDVLNTVRLDGEAAVTAGGDTLPLREWLADKRELARLSRPVLAALAERTGAGEAAELRALLAPGQSAGLAVLLANHQLIDVLRRWPSDWDPDALVAALRPLAPRLYSIASSRKRVGDEAHLAVDVLRHDAHGHAHPGTASGFLATREEGAQVPVFVEPNERFRVPADGSRDIVMIGPGTGVAPFRGFVQERAETGANGRNWLLFGARHFDTEFLYQSEWQDALRRGELHRLDAAFSRDQPEKRYIQHRLREHGRELHAWLQGGAHLYVCGAIGMGKDVHAALVDVIAEHGRLDAEDAAGYLATLQREGRYSRDVY